MDQTLLKMKTRRKITIFALVLFFALFQLVGEAKASCRPTVKRCSIMMKMPCCVKTTVGASKCCCSTKTPVQKDSALSFRFTPQTAMTISIPVISVEIPTVQFETPRKANPPPRPLYLTQGKAFRAPPV